MADRLLGLVRERGAPDMTTQRLLLHLSLFLIFGAHLARAESLLEESAPNEDVTEILIEDQPQEVHTAQSSWVSRWSGGTRTVDHLGLDFYSIFYGPPVSKMGSSYQATPLGEQSSLPLLFRNFATASYAIDDTLGVSATQYFLYVPVLGAQFAYRDPYARVYFSDLLGRDTPLSWYADLRAHVPVSNFSKASGLRLGVQTYQTLSYPVPGSRLTLGLVGSARVNLYSEPTTGNDLELYAGPNLTYQLVRNMSFTLIYDMGASHVFGDPSFTFINDGNDIQPGLSWDVTPQLNLNPFLSIHTGKNTSLAGTYLGFTMSWTVL